MFRVTFYVSHFTRSHEPGMALRGLPEGAAEHLGALAREAVPRLLPVPPHGPSRLPEAGGSSPLPPLRRAENGIRET